MSAPLAIGTRVVYIVFGGRLGTVTRVDAINGDPEVLYDLLLDGSAVRVLGCPCDQVYEITTDQDRLVDMLREKQAAGVETTLLDRSEIRDALYLEQLGVVCVEQIGVERWAGLAAN